MIKRTIIKTALIASAFAALCPPISAGNVCGSFICVPNTTITVGTPVTVIGCNCLPWPALGCATSPGSCWSGTLSATVTLNACLQSTSGTPNCANGTPVPVTLTGTEYPCTSMQLLPNGHVNYGCNCDFEDGGDPVTMTPLVLFTCTG